MRYNLKSLFLIVSFLLCGIISIKGINILSQYDWSGFGKDSNKSVTIEEALNKEGKIVKLRKETEHFQSPKTVWDWLGLGGTIAIPIVIYQFQASEQRRASKRADAEKISADETAKNQREIAEANLREEALQAYFDRMAEILIDKDRRLELLPDKNYDKDKYIDNAVRDVARVRTTTILRRLEGDEERQGHILDFLRDAELLRFILSSANLSGANLSSANLKGSNLRCADNSGADLSGANLSSANLSGADLINTNLTLANLIGANLTGANLKGANLRGADLRGADLRGTDLKDTNLSGADLSSAKLNDTDLSGANLSGANLRGTNLKATNLIGANLNGANIRDADLSDLKGTYFTKNSTLEQIKVAKNWEKAKYDPELSSSLGLLPQTP